MYYASNALIMLGCMQKIRDARMNHESPDPMWIKRVEFHKSRIMSGVRGPYIWDYTNNTAKPCE